MHASMAAFPSFASQRSRILASALVLAASCGGGGGGGDDGGSEPPDNTAPTIQVPSGLTGTAPRVTWTVPILDTASITFTANDADGDVLQWQLSGSSIAFAAAGVSAPTSATGTTFTIDLDPVLSPAFALCNVLVQDGTATAGLEVSVLRTGAPQIDGVTPASAFAGQPLAVEVTGSALALGGVVQAQVTFGGATATVLASTGETSLTCRTPTIAPSGQTVVAVSNTNGSDQLPASAFRVMPYPPTFASTALAVDSGGGATGLDCVLQEAVCDLVSIAASTVTHARSTDGGSTFGAGTLLSATETVTEAKVAALGDVVHVAWIGDSQQVWYRRSSDGGASFSAAARLDAGAQPVQGLRLAASSTHVHAAWISGSFGLTQARVTTASSANAGSSFAVPVGVASGSQNQREVEIVCSGDDLAVAWLDDRVAPQSRGVYAARSGDGGATFTSAVRLSGLDGLATSLDLSRDGSAVHVAFVTEDGVFYDGSPDFGSTWRTPEVFVRGLEDGVPSEPRVHASGDRVYVAYTTDGTEVRLGRSSDLGASFPARTRLDSANVPVSGPRITGVGDYVTVAWLSGDAGNDSVRAAWTVSTNRGDGWRAQAGAGDGISNQGSLLLRQSGARLLLGYLERRGLPIRALVNANQP